ncbi:MAG: hypothetical protein Q9163_005054, partial [Psora crenata]
ILSAPLLHVKGKDMVGAIGLGEGFRIGVAFMWDSTPRYRVGGGGTLWEPVD